MNHFLKAKKDAHHCIYRPLFPSATLPISYLFLLGLLLLLPIFRLSAQNDSVILDPSKTNALLSSTIKVTNQTDCPMILYCYELNDIGELLNMGTLLARRSIKVRPKSELGRIYAKNHLTNEETASVYFFGGTYDLKISSGCNASIKDTTAQYCPVLKAKIGDNCSDGYPSTKNDKINKDCVCEGLRDSNTINDCDSVKITASNGTIAISGLNTSKTNSVQIFTSNWKPVYTCAGNCKAVETFSGLDESYRVKVTYYTKAWAQVCEIIDTISLK